VPLSKGRLYICELKKLLDLTSRLSEVSRREIWGFFAGKSQIIAVK